MVTFSGANLPLRVPRRHWQARPHRLQGVWSEMYGKQRLKRLKRWHDDWRSFDYHFGCVDWYPQKRLGLRWEWVSPEVSYRKSIFGGFPRAQRRAAWTHEWRTWSMCTALSWLLSSRFVEIKSLVSVEEGGNEGQSLESEEVRLSMYVQRIPILLEYFVHFLSSTKLLLHRIQRISNVCHNFKL